MKFLFLKNNCTSNEMQRSSKLILIHSNAMFLSHRKGKLQLTFSHTAVSCDQVMLCERVYFVSAIGWKSSCENLLMQEIQRISYFFMSQYWTHEQTHMKAGGDELKTRKIKVWILRGYLNPQVCLFHYVMVTENDRWA